MVRRQVLEVRWLTPDPAGLGARLRASGFGVETDGVVSFPSATIRIEAGTGRTERLEVDEGARRALVVVAPHPNGIVDLVAIGFATVDRERFLADLGSRSNEELPRDPHLGAFAIRCGPTRPGPQVLVLEPDTEGRLVATLVRNAEGPAAIYLAANGGLDAFVTDARRRSTPISSVESGPLGPSVVLLGGPTWGPHLIAVDRAAGGTIPA